MSSPPTTTASTGARAKRSPLHPDVMPIAEHALDSVRVPVENAAAHVGAFSDYPLPADSPEAMLAQRRNRQPAAARRRTCEPVTALLGAGRLRALVVGMLAAAVLVAGGLVPGVAPEAAARTSVAAGQMTGARAELGLISRRDARRRAVSGLLRLRVEVSRRSKALGRRAHRDLGLLARRARSNFRRGRSCASVRALARFVSATKRLRRPAQRDAAAALGMRARQLPRLILRGARRTPSCGVKPPRVRVGRGLRPARATVPALKDGVKRPLARLVGADGDAVDFVENELLVQTRSRRALGRLLERWDGKRLARTQAQGAGAVHLIRVRTLRAPASGLSADLRRLDPLSRGSLRVSSGAGLSLLAAAADAAAAGATVGINWVAEGAQFLDRVATEAAPAAGGTATNWNPNPFKLTYMSSFDTEPSTIQDIGAAEAWRDLEIAGKLKNRVRIGVIDGGFAASADFSPASTGANAVQNSMTCNDNPCPWHGTNVASVAAAVADNGFGSAGVAGPLADVHAHYTSALMFDQIAGINDSIEHGARVINLSLSMDVPAMVTFSMMPYEVATFVARLAGSLVFASAGNKGEDVDAEDCFIFCWEEGWIAPCENAGVICVGGLARSSRSRAGGSNYGFESCEMAPCQVDIFAPNTVAVGPDPGNPSLNKDFNGTSAASPFAAGVAALIWAANPLLSDDGVERLLLDNAHSSSDATVARYVNAKRSVRAALGAVAPLVKIDAPDAGAHAAYGGINSVHFAASVFDVGDASGCCAAITWSSDVDGTLGSGPTLDHVFKSPGKRVVTVTAKDFSGATASDSITMFADNNAPSVTIEQPPENAKLDRNVVHKFAGSSFDFNEFALPCSSLTWKSWLHAALGVLVPGPGGSGCQPQFTFTNAGTYTVRLTGTDSQGATGTVARQIEVVEPPPNSPPAVTITAPDDGAGLAPHTTYTLAGVASDVDNDPITYEWTLKDGTTTKVIGNAAQITWKPADDVPPTCGGRNVTLTLTATDDDGSASDEVTVHIDWPVC